MNGTQWHAEILPCDFLARMTTSGSPGQRPICSSALSGLRFLCGPSCASIHNHCPPPQVSATDEDGPLNSAITYSLVGGNQLGHFTIHPKKGELQVAKALDWEQVRNGWQGPL